MPPAHLPSRVHRRCAHLPSLIPGTQGTPSPRIPSPPLFRPLARTQNSPRICRPGAHYAGARRYYGKEHRATSLFFVCACPVASAATLLLGASLSLAPRLQSPPAFAPRPSALVQSLDDKIFPAPELRLRCLFVHQKKKIRRRGQAHCSRNCCFSTFTFTDIGLDIPMPSRSMLEAVHIHARPRAWPRHRRCYSTRLMGADK